MKHNIEFDFWIDSRLPKNFMSWKQALKIIKEQNPIVEFDTTDHPERTTFYWTSKNFKHKDISVMIQWYGVLKPDLCVLLGTDRSETYYLDFVAEE